VPTVTATPSAPRPTASAAPQPTPPATGNNGNLPGLPNSGDGGGGPVTGLTLGALLVIALLGMMVVLRVRSPKGRA
jgi:hypothetical protein